MRNFFNSVYCALQGIGGFFLKERNGKIQLFIATVTITTALVLKLGVVNVLAIIACSCLVFTAEMFNTCIERICDIIQPQHDKRIKYIKDVAAAAVVLTCMVSLCVAAYIFYDIFIDTDTINARLKTSTIK